MNDRLRRGVSGIPSESFGRGSIAARSVAASDLRGGRMMTGNLPVVPSRDSLRCASDRSVSSTAYARMNTQQRFFSKSATAARSESFSDQASRVNQAIQRDGRFQAVNASRGGESVGANRPSGFAGAVPPWGKHPIPRRVFAGSAQPQIRGGQTFTERCRGQSNQGQATGGFQRFGGKSGRTANGQASVAQPQIRSSMLSRNSAVTCRLAVSLPTVTTPARLPVGNVSRGRVAPLPLRRVIPAVAVRH